MDVLGHFVLQGRIDHALGLHPGEAGKARRDDQRAEVASARGGPGVPGVQVALVHHLHVNGLEPLPQLLLDPLAPLGHASPPGRPV